MKYLKAILTSLGLCTLLCISMHYFGELKTLIGYHYLLCFLIGVYFSDKD